MIFPVIWSITKGILPWKPVAAALKKMHPFLYICFFFYKQIIDIFALTPFFQTANRSTIVEMVKSMYMCKVQTVQVWYLWWIRSMVLLMFWWAVNVFFLFQADDWRKRGINKLFSLLLLLETDYIVKMM